MLAVRRKSMKTAKVFFSLGFVVYGIPESSIKFDELVKKFS